MNKAISSTLLASKIWLYSALVLSIGIFTYLLITINVFYLFVFIAVITTSIAGLPAFIILIFILPLLRYMFKKFTQQITSLLFFFLLIAIIYGTIAGMIYNNPFNEYASLYSFNITSATFSAIVFIATIIAFLINIKHITTYFLLSNKNQIKMQENSNQSFVQSNRNSYSTKIWLKGLMTAGLILLMLIPTLFVSNLVQERQARQEEIKSEVSSKWAGKQNITFPYLFIPYNSTLTATNGKKTIEKKSFIILPENLNVLGSVSTEQRQRSIYSVLLYNSTFTAKGNFNLRIPADIDGSTIDWNAAKICLGISDFKGIQQKVIAKINSTFYDLSDGLPTNEIDTNGLSSVILLNPDNIGKQLYFELPLKIKGSDQLHFVPLAGNSEFTLKSNWSSPSFDGNTLPSERNLNNTGFEANWNFNKANLPFNTLLENFNFKKDDYSFGVSLLQPTDQYAKTLRCIKYAILFIGLSFSLFFIVEIMQKKPFHPVQYVLVGIALIVFYTLLLSISEFLMFDISYLIASLATVLLITLYAKSHFESWKVSAVFAGVISSIYGFIFILIRLEDTALLVGSIGLFIIVALAMFISRKINWYGNALSENAIV